MNDYRTINKEQLDLEWKSSKDFKDDFENRDFIIAECEDSLKHIGIYTRYNSVEKTEFKEWKISRYVTIQKLEEMLIILDLYLNSFDTDNTDTDTDTDNDNDIGSNPLYEEFSEYKKLFGCYGDDTSLDSYGTYPIICISLILSILKKRKSHI
jgi:hypothetical protein